MNQPFDNVYEDEERARAYATLEFPGTYYLAFRDLPVLIQRYNHGSRALDFGCGTGRSTRFLRNLGLNVTGADISQAMLDQARALDPSGEYHLIRANVVDEFAPKSFDVILSAFAFDTLAGSSAQAGPIVPPGHYCMTWDIGGSDCSFTSYSQCLATASGLDAQCYGKTLRDDEDSQSQDLRGYNSRAEVPPARRR